MFCTVAEGKFYLWYAIVPESSHLSPHRLHPYSQLPHSLTPYLWSPHRLTPYMVSWPLEPGYNNNSGVRCTVLQPQCSQPQWPPKVANQHAFCTDICAHSAYAGKTHSLPKTITTSFLELRTTATSKTSDNRSRKGKNSWRKMFTALATCLVEASSIIMYIGIISLGKLMSVY